jgi:oligosaccharide translocation protein RFT1
MVVSMSLTCPHNLVRCPQAQHAASNLHNPHVSVPHEDCKSSHLGRCKVKMPSESPANHSDGRLLTRSLGSARSLIGLQLVSRLVTFVLNQGLVRLASPQVYGTATIQFELIMSTILFLSREGVRNSLLRVWPQQTNEPSSALPVAQCANLAALPFFFGLPTTLVTLALYTFSASEATASQPHFHLALLSYATAAVGELLSEPMHNR